MKNKNIVVGFLIIAVIIGVLIYKEFKNFTSKDSQISVGVAVTDNQVLEDATSKDQLEENTEELDGLVNGFMTKKALLEDYEFVWDFIENSYPYKNICIRKGADLEALKSEYRELLFEVENEIEYYVFYETILYEVTDYRFTGHLRVVWLPSDSVDISIEDNSEIKFKKIAEFPIIKDFYAKALCQSGVLKNREAGGKIFNKFHTDVFKRYELNSSDEANIEELVLDKDISDDIGYINFLSFNLHNPEDDSTEYNEYCKDVKEMLKKFENKKHLIIDLRENKGGYSPLWMDSFVRNIITDEIYFEEYFVSNYEDKHTKLASEKLTKLYDSVDCNAEQYVYYTSSQSEFENIKFSEQNKEDKKNFDTLICEYTKVSPTEDPVSFKGKIWILIGKNTMSAAEHFAFFMREANLMSDDYKVPVCLVGEATKGIFRGFSRIQLMLPNSGLVIQSDIGYAIKADGSCIVEEGIKPDIDRGAVDALGKCRLLIKEKQGSENE